MGGNAKTKGATQGQGNVEAKPEKSRRGKPSTHTCSQDTESRDLQAGGRDRKQGGGRMAITDRTEPKNDGRGDANTFRGGRGTCIAGITETVLERSMALRQTLTGVLEGQTTPSREFMKQDSKRAGGAGIGRLRGKREV